MFHHFSIIFRGGNLLTFGVASMFQHATAGDDTWCPTSIVGRARSALPHAGAWGPWGWHPGANAMAKSQLQATELM